MTLTVTRRYIPIGDAQWDRGEVFTLVVWEYNGRFPLDHVAPVIRKDAVPTGYIRGLLYCETDGATTSLAEFDKQLALIGWTRDRIFREIFV